MQRQRIFLSPPSVDGNEQRYVAEAFASNYIAPCGPMVDRFERDFASSVRIPNACALSSATAAIDLLFARFGVTSDDTVFCSDLTFIASIAPAVRRGATPVFIDSDESTWTMNPALLEQALADAAKSGKLPKAVVAVDLYGQCCDYSRIEPICDEYGVPLIADSAEALGSVFTDVSGKEHFAGDAGVAAVYSFNGNKIITTSGGGMLASRDAAVISEARFLSQQARDPFPWYEHSRLGYNYRMSNISAAIGVGQLELLSSKVSRKRAIYDTYRDRLSGCDALTFMPEAGYCRGNRWLTVMTIDSVSGQTPEKIRLSLEKQNIESRPVWKPMHMQPVFAGVKCYGGAVSEKLFATGLCLPSGVGLTDAEVAFVSSIVSDCFI